MSSIQMHLFKDVTRPAGALEDLPVSVLDEMALVSGLAVQPPVGVYLDVGIANGDQLEQKRPRRFIMSRQNKKKNSNYVEN